MNIRYQFFLTLIAGPFFSISLNAQASEQVTADSLQRVIMKDSLQVTDSIITVIFTIRDNFFVRAGQIDSDSLLTVQGRNDAKQALIEETNTGIRNVLGQVVYDHYTEMIRRRIPPRPGRSTVKPLASGSNN